MTIQLDSRQLCKFDPRQSQFGGHFGWRVKEKVCKTFTIRLEFEGTVSIRPKLSRFANPFGWRVIEGNEMLTEHQGEEGLAQW